MTDDQQKARSWRFDPSRTCQLVQIDVDKFALFIPGNSFELAIGPWDELRYAFLAREPYIKKPVTSKEAARKELLENLVASLELDL